MRALISVSDKTGVVEFAKGLRTLGWEVIATGGTMKLLADSGVEVINISDVTGFPEICDGRVKTLHPNVHGGLLARRDDPEHLKALKDNHIEFIDMVCVNLYPFRETISKPGAKMEDAIENIDIGGPSMLRSAAKNWADVTVVCDPADYDAILDEIRAGGNTEKATRLKLSAKAYTHTAEYDAMIATYMRIIGDELLGAYGGRIINIHPSLLPAFRGAHAIEQALEYGVKVFGVTIHYVDAELDGGRIIAQRAFPYEGDDIGELEAMIHAVEYPLYIETIKKLIE